MILTLIEILDLPAMEFRYRHLPSILQSMTHHDPHSHPATERRIGGHVSAAGGLDKAIERAAAIGANCVQVFSGSPRVWARSPLEKVDTAKVFSKQQELSINPIFTHTIYLTNVASDNPNLVQKSAEVLKYDLQFDSLVKGSGVVVHLGSHQGRGWEAVKEQTARVIAEVLQNTPADSHLLIENSAGQQGKLCSDLSEVRWLFDAVKSTRLRWCLDTCHAWCAGLSLGKVGRDGQKTAIEVIEELDLADKLTLVHVNDSRDPFASGRDRHANLGDGEIPPAELAYFLTHPFIKDKPLVLEVPGIEGDGPDAENIQRLRTLAGLGK